MLDQIVFDIRLRPSEWGIAARRSVGPERGIVVLNLLMVNVALSWRVSRPAPVQPFRRREEWR